MHYLPAVMSFCVAFLLNVKYKSPVFVDVASKLDDEEEGICRIDELISEESTGTKILA